MDIKNTIYKMLTTNTGIHMMDSGGGEGRHWQTNIKKSLVDFENEPEVSYEKPEEEIESGELCMNISTFHYLTRGGLELDQACLDFNKKQNKDWDSDIYGVSESLAKWLDKQGFEIGDSFNTYNGESNLSQVLQGTYCKLGVESYVLLQIHQGADVRGGYTDAKLFHLPDDYMPSEDIYGTVDGQEVSNTYNGYSLTLDDDNGSGKTIAIKPDSEIILSLG